MSPTSRSPHPAWRVLHAAGAAPARALEALARLPERVGDGRLLDDAVDPVSGVREAARALEALAAAPELWALLGTAVDRIDRGVMAAATGPDAATGDAALDPEVPAPAAARTASSGRSPAPAARSRKAAAKGLRRGARVTALAAPPSSSRSVAELLGAAAARKVPAAVGASRAATTTRPAVEPTSAPSGDRPWWLARGARSPSLRSADGRAWLAERAARAGVAGVEDVPVPASDAGDGLGSGRPVSAADPAAAVDGARGASPPPRDATAPLTARTDGAGAGVAPGTPVARGRGASGGRSDGERTPVARPAGDAPAAPAGAAPEVTRRIEAALDRLRTTAPRRAPRPDDDFGSPVASRRAPAAADPVSLISDDEARIGLGGLRGLRGLAARAAAAAAPSAPGPRRHQDAPGPRDVSLTSPAPAGPPLPRAVADRAADADLAARIARILRAAARASGIDVEGVAGVEGGR